MTNANSIQTWNQRAGPTRLFPTPVLARADRIQRKLYVLSSTDRGLYINLACPRVPD